MISLVLSEAQAPRPGTSLTRSRSVDAKKLWRLRPNKKHPGNRLGNFGKQALPSTKIKMATLVSYGSSDEEDHIEVDVPKLNVSLSIKICLEYTDKIGQADRPTTPKFHTNGHKSGTSHYPERYFIQF